MHWAAYSMKGSSWDIDSQPLQRSSVLRRAREELTTPRSLEREIHRGCLEAALQTPRHTALASHAGRGALEAKRVGASRRPQTPSSCLDKFPQRHQLRTQYARALRCNPIGSTTL